MQNGFDHRKDRITASVAGEIVHQRRTTPPDVIVKRICYRNDTPNSNNNIPNSCLHGLTLEADAREEYINCQQSNGYQVDVQENGLVVDVTYSWLGASVDGVVSVSHPVFKPNWVYLG